jgi:hypothetical protein
MVVNLKAVTLGDAVLQGFEGFVFELDDSPTLQTDEMIVMSLVKDGFVPRLSTGEFPLRCEAQPGEQLHGSVNGGVTDFRIRIGHKGVNLVETLVPLGIEKDVRDSLPLFGDFQSPSGKKGLEGIGSNWAPL